MATSSFKLWASFVIIRMEIELALVVPPFDVWLWIRERQNGRRWHVCCIKGCLWRVHRPAQPDNTLFIAYDCCPAAARRQEGCWPTFCADMPIKSATSPSLSLTNGRTHCTLAHCSLLFKLSRKFRVYRQKSTLYSFFWSVSSSRRQEKCKIIIIYIFWQSLCFYIFFRDLYPLLLLIPDCLTCFKGRKLRKYNHMHLLTVLILFFLLSRIHSKGK